MLRLLIALLAFSPLLVVDAQRCLGAFDMYFVLDNSGSVQNHFQNETVGFVRDICSSFISPDLGVSFVTFADQAEVILPLTTDRIKINRGLEILGEVDTYGKTRLSYGLQEINEQIVKKGGDRASVILALTDGELNDRDKAQIEADRSRKLGASVFTVGVANYNLSELQSIADKPSKDHVFLAGSYSNLDSVIDKIVDKACIEIRAAEPATVCARAPYDVILSGRGFTRTNNISNVICSFRVNGTSRVTKPKSVQSRRLECPGPLLEADGSTATLQVSVNGKTFVSSNITVTASACIPEAKKSYTGVILGLFLFFLLLFLLLLWWFWPLLFCAKPEQPEPPPESPTNPEKGKWPKVDASYYGRGAGGIAPMRVSWGRQGSTEAGSKLSKAKGAQELPEEEAQDQQKKPSCLDIFKSKLSLVKSWMIVAYKKVAAYRPRPGGNSKLYTSSPNAYNARPLSSISSV